jgi:putative ABC transport system permease protein
MMATLLQDIRFGLRLLTKSRGLTVVMILTLALGVGANTALFSVVDAVLLRPLPFPQPEQLVALKIDEPGMNLVDVGMSQPELTDMQQNSGVFDDISAVWPISSNITGREKPFRVEAQAISFNFFPLLGAKPAMGRVIDKRDYADGFTTSAVISDGAWHKMYGGDPNVLGKTFLLDMDLYTVVGVMPPEFRHPARTLGQDVDVWVATGFAADPFPKPPVRTQRFIPGAIGRLKPGLNLQQAQQKLDAFAAHLQQQYPTDYPIQAQWHPRLVPLQKSIVGDTSLMLFLLLAAVGAVLLIACVNIASLLLARSATRHREIAVRQALGASAWRLIRQTLTESIVLALCGGALAIPVSFLLKHLLLTLVPSTLPRVHEIKLNGTALLFALGISLATGLLFGIAPAIQMSDPRVMDKLNQGARGMGIGARQQRFLSGLVVCEFAISLILLVGAGLLLRSFWKVLQVQPGFNAENLVTAHVWLPVPNDPKRNPYPNQPKRNVLLGDVLRRLNALPGVTGVGIGGSNTPFAGLQNDFTFQINGRPASATEAPTAEFAVLTSDLLNVLGTPVVRGRAFTDADDDKGEKVAMIDETAAEKYWPNSDPLGSQVTFTQFGPKQPLRRIVGVVARSRGDGLDAPFRPHIYVPARQVGMNEMTVYIRTSSSPEALEDSVRREIQAVDPDLPVYNVRSLRGVIAESLASRRFAMQVLGFFAATALLLAAIGIYGVMAYFVSQRVREIGVRMALGAQRGDVLKLVVRQGMALALVGVLVGFVSALALTHLMSRLLFGVSAYDPLTLAAFTLLLASVALLANFIPARRASMVDPMTALRYE